MKPIFIALKSEYYQAFLDGSKRIEYRRAGVGQFTLAKCIPGRDVTLSKGYGRRDRIRGTVVNSWIEHHEHPTGAIADCYGTEPIDILAIEILVDCGEDRWLCNCQDIGTAKRWASFIKRSGLFGKKICIIRKGSRLELEGLSRIGRQLCDVIGPSERAIAQAKRHVGIVDIVQLIIPGMEKWMLAK